MPARPRVEPDCRNSIPWMRRMRTIRDLRRCAAIVLLDSGRACSSVVRAGDSSFSERCPGVERCRVDGTNSGKPSSASAADGNPEPSRRYTAGRCRDYLRASSALDDRQERPAPSRPIGAAGEEIVRACRKRRDHANPLVLGSNPSGPTISRHRAGCRRRRGEIATTGLTCRKCRLRRHSQIQHCPKPRANTGAGS